MIEGELQAEVREIGQRMLAAYDLYLDRKRWPDIHAAYSELIGRAAALAERWPDQSALDLLELCRELARTAAEDESCSLRLRPARN